MDLRKSRKVCMVLSITGTSVALIGQIFKQPVVSNSLLFVGLGLIVAGLVIIFKFWKCPHCGRSLPTRESDIVYCPYCSKKL